MKTARKKLIDSAKQTAIEKAKAAVSEGKKFCISRVNDGLDVAAVGDIAQHVIKQKVCNQACS